MASREELICVFQDTMAWCREEPMLVQKIAATIAGTQCHTAGDPIELPEKPEGRRTDVSVSRQRSFAAAMQLHGALPDARIAVHNFASAHHPGGGVARGCRAQEESLCRCSTLYPVLDTPELWEQYYDVNRAAPDSRNTDTCLYTPGVLIIKTDTDKPERLAAADWCEVDVLTCAAPDLRTNSYTARHFGRTPLTDAELFALHKARAVQLLSVAAAHGVEVLVLGAFGCGAFQNPPEIVAAAYREVLPAFDGYFRKVEFAVYTGAFESRNYTAFRDAFADWT